MSKPFIIGLCGFARSGKSTVAKYLAENHEFVSANFKDELVAELRKNLKSFLLCYIDEYNSHLKEGDVKLTWDNIFEIKPPAIRALMQGYGTEVRRGDNKNYWVKKWIQSLFGKNLVIVDDVRFPNEYDAVKDMGGIVIRVKRSDITTGGTHESEIHNLSFKEDFTIEAAPNDHAGAYAQLETIIDTIKINND